MRKKAENSGIGAKFHCFISFFQAHPYSDAFLGLHGLRGDEPRRYPGRSRHPEKRGFARVDGLCGKVRASGKRVAPP